MYFSNAYTPKNHALNTIPDDVRRFIQQGIPSVPYLEALLLLRDNPAQGWDPRHLAQRLYLGEAEAARLLAQLRQAGVAGRDGAADAAFRYAPSSPALGQLLDRLAQAYASHLVEVSELIHLKSHRKARLFADAFVWRKDK